MGTHSTKATKILSEALQIFAELAPKTKKRKLGICKHAFRSLLVDYSSTKKYIAYCLMKRGLFGGAKWFFEEFLNNFEFELNTTSKLCLERHALFCIGTCHYYLGNIQPAVSYMKWSLNKSNILMKKINESYDFYRCHLANAAKISIALFTLKGKKKGK